MSTLYQQYNQDRGEDDLPPPPPSSTGYTHSAMSSRPTTSASQYDYSGNYLRDIGGGQNYGLRGHYDEHIQDDRTEGGHSDGQILIGSRWSRSQPAGRVPVGKSDGGWEE